MSDLKIMVQKYGGTSVGTPERIKAVAERIKSYVRNGYSVVVVVSAMGKTTDELISLASQLTRNPSGREMDMLLSTGEQVSISLLAMALHEIGIDAVSYTGSQIKMMTDGNFSKAKIESISTDRIEKSLRDSKVVIVAGFQGIDADENITTLGRGGSDTSAVALATVLGTRDCEIYTDVNGVYTADPRIIAKTVKLKEISYDEMLELARLGAAVLHSRSVEFAKKYNVRLHVRSSFNYEEGTIVMPKEEMMEKFVISGVTAKRDEAKITIRDIPDRPGIASRVFGPLGENKIYVNMIVQSTGKDNKASISFTVLKSDVDRALKLCEGLKKDLGASAVDSKQDIAIVSAVGVGMLSSYGVAGKIFQVLSDQNINIEMISTSEIGISCVIDDMYAELAQKVIHKIFIEAEGK
ncbi:MAG TPA: aspartate kinase [Spirochaetota bacterium]|nr:aspartate kinase [Spirochaetota bacterium]HOD13522.1 aspartate kinase [Spirochaetota bacterium]HPG51169.1 aspartate kinase [Spirochaetota bacterium]HPN13280.1 aspartate kinase [Spirochaetota bacterium]HQL81092.1 aspartate kinase [Spirochaetota bacterium]